MRTRPPRSVLAAQCYERPVGTQQPPEAGRSNQFKSSLVDVELKLARLACSQNRESSASGRVTPRILELFLTLPAIAGDSATRNSENEQRRTSSGDGYNFEPGRR